MCAQCTHADLTHSHYWKIWLCNVLKIKKRENIVPSYWYKETELGHERTKDFTYLELSLIHFLPLPLFLYLWVSHDNERLNDLLLGAWQPNTLDIMILTVHLLLFQYYCFFSEFIVLFMVWSPMHMYVIRFTHWEMFAP